MPPHLDEPMKMTCSRAALTGVEEQDKAGVGLAIGISDCTTSVISGRYSAFVWTHIAAMAATCSSTTPILLCCADAFELQRRTKGR